MKLCPIDDTLSQFLSIIIQWFLFHLYKSQYATVLIIKFVVFKQLKGQIFFHKEIETFSLLRTR